jgi:hypothetical protein
MEKMQFILGRCLHLSILEDADCLGELTCLVGRQRNLRFLTQASSVAVVAAQVEEGPLFPVFEVRGVVAQALGVALVQALGGRGDRRRDELELGDQLVGRGAPGCGAASSGEPSGQVEVRLEARRQSVRMARVTSYSWSGAAVRASVRASTSRSVAAIESSTTSASAGTRRRCSRTRATSSSRSWRSRTASVEASSSTRATVSGGAASAPAAYRPGPTLGRSRGWTGQLTQMTVGATETVGTMNSPEAPPRSLGARMVRQVR